MSILSFFKKKVNKDTCMGVKGLYDLAELYETGGDEYVLQMLHIYLTDCPISIQAMKDAILVNDAAMVMAHAHKLKGSAGILKATTFYALLHEAEQLSSAGTCSKQLEKAVHASSAAYVAMEPLLQSVFEILKNRR
jgi:HPt (histidine-containing phosphotransfer) domain-containing protein